MTRALAFIALMAGFSSLPVFADACGTVVEDTVAEMRAGASGDWSGELEAFIRSAAGSACVKALSGRYPDVAKDALSPEAQAVAVTSETVESSDEAQDAQSAEGEDAEGDDSWSVGGLTFRGLSGSPGAKPYQRQQRERDEEE